MVFNSKKQEIALVRVRCYVRNNSVSYTLPIPPSSYFVKQIFSINVLNNVKFNFNDFVSLVREEIGIAAACNNEKELPKKWKFFLPIRHRLFFFSFPLVPPVNCKMVRQCVRGLVHE